MILDSTIDEIKLTLKLLLFIKEGKIESHYVNFFDDSNIRNHFKENTLPNLKRIFEEAYKTNYINRKQIDISKVIYEITNEGELCIKNLQTRLADKEKENHKNEELRQSVINTNQVQRNILILTLFFSLISLIISWCNYKKPSDQKLYVLPSILKQDTTIITGVPLNKNCDDSCQNNFKK